jgi:hypothetical protein
MALAIRFLCRIASFARRTMCQPIRPLSPARRRAICSEVIVSDQRWPKESLKSQLTRVLKVIRRCATFQVALGFVQLLPSHFARIPGQRFQASLKGAMDKSFYRRVSNQMPGILFASVAFLSGS